MVASASSSNTQWPSGCWRRAARRSRRGCALCQSSVVRRRRSSRLVRDRHEVARERERTSSAARLPDRMAPSMRRRQAGVGPIAGQEQIAPIASRRPGAWRPAPASPRRSRAARARSARAAARRGKPAIAATSRQIVCGELLARHVEQPVGAADGDREPAGKREQPFDVAVEHADDRRHGRPADRCGNAR